MSIVYCHKLGQGNGFSVFTITRLDQLHPPGVPGLDGDSQVLGLVLLLGDLVTLLPEVPVLVGDDQGCGLLLLLGDLVTLSPVGVRAGQKLVRLRQVPVRGST